VATLHGPVKHLGETDLELINGETMGVDGLDTQGCGTYVFLRKSLAAPNAAFDPSGCRLEYFI